MNRLKKKENIKTESGSGAATPAKPGLVLRSIKALMDGSFLSGSGTARRLPYFLFIFGLVVVYVANTHNAEKRIRQTASMTKEINNMRSEYISLQSQLVLSSNPSKIAEKLINSGIAESKEPLGGTLFYTQNDLKPFLDPAE
jgi:hypothetical protein